VTVSDPQHPERVYAASGAGLFRSDDGGQTWNAASQGMDAPNALAIGWISSPDAQGRLNLTVS